MAVNTTVFDVATGKTKTISFEMESNVLQQQGDADTDFYLKISTGAKKTNGGAIGPFYVTGLNDLADGATQHGGGGGSYADLTALAVDYIRHAIEGDGAGQEMSFS
jgi:hypothetical protein